MPASYEDLLDQFFTDYSHHFTPSGTPHKVDPKAYIEAERLRRAGSISKSEAARDFVNKARAERGLPPVGEQAGGVPQGQNGLSRAEMEVLSALQQMAKPREDDTGPTAWDYVMAVPGTAVAAYNNNMPRVFGERATVDGLLHGTPGVFFDQAGDSFNKVLDHAVPYSARKEFNDAVDAAGHAGAAMMPATHVAPGVNVQARTYNEAPLISEAQLRYRAAQRAADLEREKAATRARDPLERVEIRRPERTPSAEEPPATPSGLPSSEPTGTATAPQSSATSAGSAGTTSNPQSPASSPPVAPPPPKPHPSVDLLIRMMDARGFTPAEIEAAYRDFINTGKLPNLDAKRQITTIEPKRFPDVRLAEEPQIGGTPPVAPDVPQGPTRPIPLARYSAAHREAAQPTVLESVRNAFEVPSERDIASVFDVANLKPPALGNRLNNARDIVEVVKNSGGTADRAADTLEWAMKLKPAERKAAGYGPLPVVVGPTIAAAAALSKSEPDHHSDYQPRRKDGTFNGPPSKDWYADNGDEK